MHITGISIFNSYKNNKLPFSQSEAKKNDLSFGRYGVDGTKLQRFLEGFPCPCCGIEMLSFKDLKRPLHMPENTPSEKIIPILSKYEKSMHPIEREVFDILKSLSKEYPKKNLRQLLDTQREKYLEILHMEQKNILRRLSYVSQFLSPQEEAKLEKTIKETEKILNDKNSTEQFKRRIFVGKIKYTSMNFKEKGVVKRIFEIAEEMPKASNNTAAFIVKHTEKKPATGQERTSNDIVWGLLSPSLATIEHIRVRSKNVTNGGGKDEMRNFLIECARDNNERSSMPLDEFARLHPEYYGRKLQRHINLVAQKINETNALYFAPYPKKVLRTLRKESKGTITARTPKIDIKNA